MSELTEQGAHRVAAVLLEEAQADLLAEVGAIVAHQRAAALVAECKAALAEAEKNVKRLAKSAATMAAELAQLQDELPPMRAALEVAQGQRIRIKAGLAAGDLPDVGALDAAIHAQERAADRVRSALTTEKNRLTMAQSNRDNLAGVLAALQGMARPEPVALPILAAALG